MQTLFKILQRYSIFLLFLLLEGVAIVLLVHRNAYQQHVFMSSANMISGGLYAWEADVLEYFHLRADNEALNRQNKELLERITALENQLSLVTTSVPTIPWAQVEETVSITECAPDSIRMQADSLRDIGDSINANKLLASYGPKDSLITTSYIPADNDFSYICAKVVNWSVNKQHNFLTINKGSRDSVEVGMGVINADGVVGIVKAVGLKFSTVIPLINPDMEASARIASNNHIGPVKWNGGSYQLASLQDIARHVPLKVGDKLITSGFTTAFPEGLMIGTVEKADLEDTDAYYRVQVKLSVDFTSIKHVMVIKNHNRAEEESVTNPTPKK